MANEDKNKPGTTSVGTQLGTTVRRLAPLAGAAARGVVNTPIRSAETAVNLATGIPRQVGGVIRDAAAAAQGQTSPQQGQPIAPVRFPRLLTPSPAAAPGAVATGAQATPLPQNYSPGPSTRGRRSLDSTGAIQSPEFNLQPGDPNTFTGSNGVTRAVPGLVGAQPPGQTAPTQVATLNSTAPAVQETTRRTLAGNQIATTNARQQIGAGLNPMSDQGELMRRLEISQGSFKGSPSARAAVARALLGQMDALTDATATGQQGANRILEQGAGSEATGNESFVRRRLDADQFNTNTAERRRQTDAENTAVTEVVRGQDGTASALRRDGSLRRLTNEDGTPFRSATTTQSPLSADSLLKSYTDRLAAIEQSTSTADEKKAQVDAVNADPLYAPLRGAQNGSPYAEGTRLTGPGGKRYVVRNGQPVQEQ